MAVLMTTAMSRITAARRTVCILLRIGGKRFVASIGTEWVNMPDLVCLFSQRDAASIGVAIDTVEQAEVDASGILEKQRKVNAYAVTDRAQRIGNDR